MVHSQHGLHVLVCGGASDAHTWNLVCLQLLLEEAGHRVTNLGPCVPEELLARECLTRRPDVVVIGSVNGHGYQDGLRAVRHLRREPSLVAVPVALGGKLGVAGVRDTAAADALRAAGCTAVFDDGDLDAFRTWVDEFAGPRKPSCATADRGARTGTTADRGARTRATAGAPTGGSRA
ncbi:cobalamin-dependent protein [Streptomyces longwoodensis]|uniref:cobalamin B12-binding domain-containing protein n=1 Tax=Streptomyces longwoodensis TaxID=68231 RepID=UPI0033C28967